MNCQFCGEHETNEKTHEYSITHKFNLFNYYKKQYENRKDLKLDEQIKVIDTKNELEEQFEDMKQDKSFACSNCDFVAESLNEALHHEKYCHKFVRDIEPVKEKKLLSNEIATCDKCGKVYLHTTKLLPRYALNRHQKTCKGINFDKEINNHLKCLDNLKKKQILDYIKTL